MKKIRARSQLSLSKTTLPKILAYTQSKLTYFHIFLLYDKESEVTISEEKIEEKYFIYWQPFD